MHILQGWIESFTLGGRKLQVCLSVPSFLAHAFPLRPLPSFHFRLFPSSALLLLSSTPSLLFLYRPGDPPNPVRGRGALWAPQRVREEPGRQTVFGAFWVKNHCPW